MSKLEQLFAQYDASHQNSTNRICHQIGIPLIIGGLLSVFFFDKTLGWTSFGVGWVFQIVGHYVEGSKPEFLSNPLFLIVGPIYFVKKIFGKLSSN